MVGRTFYSLRGLFLLSALALTSCASSSSGNSTDPFESYNRTMYAFNDFLDRNLLKPVANAYTTVVPDPVETGIANFYGNLRYPLVTVNQFLQGKPEQGFRDGSRFVINSTVGIAGFFDPATAMGLQSNEEDFGQTFARWGIGSGPYIVLPVLGPATFRDGTGRLVHAFSTYIPAYIEDIPVRNSVIALDFVNDRAQQLGAEAMITGPDPYIFVREAYLQRREYLISDREVE